MVVVSSRRSTRCFPRNVVWSSMLWANKVGSHAEVAVTSIKLMGVASAPADVASGCATLRFLRACVQSLRRLATRAIGNTAVRRDGVIPQRLWGLDHGMGHP